MSSDSDADSETVDLVEKNGPKATSIHLINAAVQLPGSRHCPMNPAFWHAGMRLANEAAVGHLQSNVRFVRKAASLRSVLNGRFAQVMVLLRSSKSTRLTGQTRSG